MSATSSFLADRSGSAESVLFLQEFSSRATLGAPIARALFRHRASIASDDAAAPSCRGPPGASSRRRPASLLRR
eukprot:12349614-Heterocapsa_arctica.AAC.1